MDGDKPVVANSPSFEYVYVANQRCACGGYFAVSRQELCQLPSGPVDRLTAACQRCGAECCFSFDISSFFGDLEKYSRFHQTDSRFREALTCVREGRLPAAEAALRRVIDPQEGEPAFAWAHYHLGVVLLEEGRADEAVVCLARAAAIQPLEPAIHEPLARACQAAGRDDEAQAHFQESRELRVRFGTEAS
jgi:Flp pilus assembly protein TadD